jgi:ABC-type antimicrobial peptide transport system permease subunit
VGEAIRAAARISAPDLAILSAGSAELLLGGPDVLLKLISYLVTGLGAITLLLAMTGLYGVQADIVSRRTREFGVRMAMGAAGRRIAAMVVRDSFRPVVDGLALGLIAGTLGRGILRAFVEEETALFDPLATLLIPIPLIIAASLACYLPARRASRVDPNVALRDL